MVKPCKFVAVIDGKPHRGEWLLMQGGRICVRSAWGSDSADVGRGDPNACARELLASIVAAYRIRHAEDRERYEELRRIRRTLWRSPPPPEA